MYFKRLFSIGLLLIMTLALTGCFSVFSSDSKRANTPKKVSATSEEVKAQLSLAAAYMMDGDYNNAMPELMKAREMDPKSADVENVFGLAYYGMKNNNLAIESYKKALSYDSSRADVRNNLGLAYLTMQQYDQAVQEFNTCLASPSYQKKHLPLTNLGIAYLEMSRFDDAVNALNQAIQENPNYPKAHQQLGRVYLTRGNNQAALDALEKAMQLAPNDPETNALYNDARSRLGRR